MATSIQPMKAGHTHIQLWWPLFPALEAQRLIHTTQLRRQKSSYSRSFLHEERKAIACFGIFTDSSRKTSNQVQNLNQCPAAFARFGRGYVGYIRDLNNEFGSQKLVMALLGKSNSIFLLPRMELSSTRSELSPSTDLQFIWSETAISSYEVRIGNQTRIPLELNRMLEAQSSRQQSEPVDPDMPDLIDGCLVCGALRPVKKCARCTTAHYCSADCQKEDW